MSLLRSLSESLVCLALAVVVFRTFEVEGYMISTGSMAPHLLGFHKRTTCPSCGWRFTCGVMYDDSVADEAHANGEHGDDPLHAVCPNCGLPSIDLSRVPRNHGDQLLVAKAAYQLASPRRWDVAVFRNPGRSTQAYVKRVVALPGEAVRVVHGDVWIDGTIRRKDLAAQRALRIPVYDAAYEPPDDDAFDWQSRWFHGEGSAWSRRDGGFAFAAPADEQGTPGAYDWLTYRHWIRMGGYHTTTVLLSEEAPQPKLPDTPFPTVRYNPDAGTLSCTGALPQDLCDNLEALNPDERLCAAIEQLYEESHIVPVMDEYGYNRLSAGMLPVPVRDLMLSAHLAFEETEGEAAIEMGDGHQTFTLEFRPGRSEVTLTVDGSARPARRAALPPALAQTGGLVEFSLFDRQVLVAVDGELLFEPLLLDDVPADDRPATPPRRPVRIGARGVNLAVHSLVLYRDVHYTRGKAKNGVDEPYRLDDRSYFMLGDNSPVSSDSRNWDDGAVPRELLLGKPFVVHLPSRPARFEFAGRQYQIRIPDVSQIRYIR